MDHSDVLSKLCQICGRSVVSKAVNTKYPCSKHGEMLQRVFDLSVLSDDPSVHPTHFCHACKTVVHKFEPNYTHRTTVFKGWCTHSEGECLVCEHYSGMQRGGRPKKVKKTPGRPPTVNPWSCISHVEAVAPPPFVPSDDSITLCSTHQPDSLSDIYCPLCSDILKSPIELVTCGYIVCAPCLSRWLICREDDLSCPSCYSDHLRDFTTIRQAPPIVNAMLGNLCVICPKCKQHTKLHLYKTHIVNHSVYHHHPVLVKLYTNQSLHH